MANSINERDTLLEEGSPASFGSGNRSGGWARRRPVACFVGLVMLCTVGLLALGALLRGRIQFYTAVAVDDMQQLAKVTWTFHDPDPSYLRWDTKIEIKPGLMVYDGWLKVPLSHDFVLEEKEPSPSMCVRVMGKPANHKSKKPAEKGVLLMHCGGPGSGRDCPVKTFKEAPFQEAENVMGKFDLIGIDQRGVNFWGLSANGDNPLLKELQDEYDKKGIPKCPWQDAAPFPHVYCNEFEAFWNSKQGSKDIGSLIRTIGLDGGETRDEMARFAKFVKGTSLGNDMESGLDYDKEFHVRMFYRLMQLEHNLCYKAPRYQVVGKNGRKYNALHHTGTVDLAHDLEVFREAIGADQISVRGSSYGTLVAGVYSTIFPHSVDRVLMDGVMAGGPDVRAMATANAAGVEAVLNGQYIACDNSLAQQLPADEVCPAAPAVSQKVLKMITDQSLPARASRLYRMLTFQMRETDVKYTAHTMACIQQLWSDTKVKGCPAPLPSKAAPAHPGDKDDTQDKHRILKNDDKTKNHGKQKERIVKYPRERFWMSMPGAVIGLDVSGRLSEEAVISWWRESLQLFPIGVQMGLSIAVAIGTWPAAPRPIPPLGNSLVAPLIVGNLHDGQTSYRNAQKMKQAFQQGSMMTYQGYGHTMQFPENATAVMDKYKKEVAAGKLPEYTNELAKLLCGKVAFEYLLTKKLPPDGHVCKLATQVPVGSKAALATPAPFWLTQ